MSDATLPTRHYRLTRPDGLGFFHRRSAPQFAICCAGTACMLASVVVGAAGPGGRMCLGLVGTLVVVVGAGRTPTGEDLVELIAPLARFCSRRVRHADRYSAALVPWRGPELPPLFAGISLVDADPKRLGPAGTRIGVVFDRADGSVSVVLRVHGEGFLLADSAEKDARVDAFGDALASLCREDGAVARVAWSQFTAPASIEEHYAYLDQTAKSEPDEAMRNAYLTLLATTGESAVRSEVLVVISVGLDRVRATAQHGGDRLRAAIDRLLDESQLFSTELVRAGLSPVGPLPAGAVARAVRDRLDPDAMFRLERRGRSLAETAGLVTPANGFPLAIEEQRASVRTDETWHRLFRVAEWPRVAVRADWLASFLCEGRVTRSFTVVFSPQSRRLARRQASAVATRVGATIEERATHGKRVGAEERRAQEAAEALDEELEAGAGMELLVGLVDVTAPSEEWLQGECDRTLQAAANVGVELRPVAFRQGEALVCSLPLGRLVAGRAR